MNEVTGILLAQSRETFSVMFMWFLPFWYMDLVIFLSVKSKVEMVDELQGGRGGVGVKHA